jgi:hypothetical protein
LDFFRSKIRLDLLAAELMELTEAAIESEAKHYDNQEHK